MPRFIKISFYKKKGETRLFCVLVVAFRVATGFRPPGWWAYQLVGIPQRSPHTSQWYPPVCQGWRLKRTIQALPNLFPLQTPATTRHLLTNILRLFTFVLHWTPNGTQRGDKIIFFTYAVNSCFTYNNFKRAESCVFLPLPRKTCRENKLAEKVKQLIK